MCSTEDRIKALAEYLVEDIEDIDEEDQENLFSIGRREYFVLTEEEADELAHDYITESVWAFNPSFIIEHSKLPWEAEEMIKGFQEAKCEGANDTILALIDNIDRFVSDAIDADGRGHFINSYDGDEEEVSIETDNGTEYLYIYRMD